MESTLNIMLSIGIFIFARYIQSITIGMYTHTAQQIEILGYNNSEKGNIQKFDRHFKKIGYGSITCVIGCCVNKKKANTESLLFRICNTVNMTAFVRSFADE